MEGDVGLASPSDEANTWSPTICKAERSVAEAN
ncbi:hypothetical protein PRJ_Fausto_00497 [Faustovirus]|nr:hypothetical protein PRJ_Fausto_00497 [Faustovirus]